MNEAALYAAIIKTLTTLLPSYGYDAVDVRQGYQQRLVGGPTGAALLLHKIVNHRHGFVGRFDKWDVPGSKMVHTEKQAREFTFQCTAQLPLLPLVPGPGAKPPQYAFTAGDLANDAATILASDDGVRLLFVAGLGIERITSVREAYWKDEGDQFEQAPNFDFVLAFTQERTTTTPVLETEEFRIFRV